MSQVITWPANKSLVLRHNINTGANSGCGKNKRMYVGRDGNFNYWTLQQFDQDWSAMTAGSQIIRATMVLTTDDGLGGRFPLYTKDEQKPRIAVRRMKAGGAGLWDAGNNTDETFDASDYDDAEYLTADAFSRYMSKADNSITNLDVTAMVEDMAPKTIKRRNGTAGGAATNHGFGFYKTDTKEKYQWSGWSYYASTAGYRPYIEVEFEPGHTKPYTPTDLSPSGSVASIGAFNGTFYDDRDTDTLAKTEVEVYASDGTSLLWSRKQVASETEKINKISNVTPDEFSPTAGVTYKWRMRQYDQEGQVSLFTSLLSFSVSNTDPNAPSITPTSGSSFPDGLTGVMFRGGTFVDVDGDNLMAYQVQLSAYPSGSGNWDIADYILWDTGKVYVVAGSTDWETPYGGKGLSAGTYYVRARHWDDKNGVSAWSYVSITTGEFDAEPGTQPDIVIGGKIPYRLVIKEMKFNNVGGALTGNATTDVFTTASNHGLKAGQKVRLTGLTGGTGLYAEKDYWVDTVPTTKTFTLEDENGSTVDFSSNVTAGNVKTVTTRGPGDIIAIFEHGRSLGASKVWNSPGEMHFTLLASDPQIDYIEPKQTHYAVQFYAGDGWRETYAGLVWDFDATDNDVVITGLDYLALFDLVLDERYFPEDPDKAAANGGSYYSAKTIRTVVIDQLKRAIGLKNSPVGFISLGSIAAMNEKVSIYSTMQPCLSFVGGLLDSHRQGTGKRTQIKVVRVSEGVYQVTVVDDPGTTRDNLRLSYGELVQGYRIIPFGPEWASVQHAVGTTREGVKVMYKTASAPGIDQQVWGRIARVEIMQNVADEKDLERRVKQAAIRSGKLGKQLGLALRSGILSPLAGHDICDIIPVNIVDGAIDTNRFGSGYWQILAEAWEAGDDGSQNLILTLAPKEDSVPPDDDLLDTAGNTSSQAEWQIGWQPPDPLTTSSEYWLDQSTGKVYRRTSMTPMTSYSCTALASTDVITATGHTLAAGDRVVFKALVPSGSGLVADVPYYVSANGLGTDVFKVTDDDIDDIDIEVDITSATVALIAKAITGVA